MVCYVRRKMPHNQNRILTHTRLCHSIVPKPINPKVYHPLASCCPYANSIVTKPINPKVYHPLASCCPYAPSLLSACPSVCSPGDALSSRPHPLHADGAGLVVTLAVRVAGHAPGEQHLVRPAQPVAPVLRAHGRDPVREPRLDRLPH